jgi:hypothetical protein
MNKLTTINTIKKAAPLALLAVVMSGSAFAGPNGSRPTGPKLSIDVDNYCYFDANPRYLVIETTVTPSGSQVGDNGGVFGTPMAQAAFRDEDCKFTPQGKEVCKSAGFVAVGAPKPMDEEDPFDWSSAPGKDPSPDAYSTSIDLCAVNPDILSETVVNALVQVTVTDDDGATTWASACDDVWFDSDDDPYDDGEDRVDQSDLQLDGVSIVCSGD